MNSLERTASTYKSLKLCPACWAPGGPDLVPADKTRHAVRSAEHGVLRVETQRCPPHSPLPPSLPMAGLKEAPSFGSLPGVLSTLSGQGYTLLEHQSLFRASKQGPNMLDIVLILNW